MNNASAKRTGGSRGTVNFTRQALAANDWIAELSLGD
jgi:hypothetical protein